MSELKPCPFCGKPPVWTPNSGSYGYTPSTLHLGCACELKPGLARVTEEWEQGRGHYDVDPREAMARIWNARAGDTA